MHRVVFPMEMKLCNTTNDGPDSDPVYNLFSVVVHSGSSINHGMNWQAGQDTRAGEALEQGV